MGKYKIEAIDFIKTNKVTKNFYNKMKSLQHSSDFKIDSIPVPQPQKSRNTNIRMNIIVPSIRKSKVFGGTGTAIRVLTEISEKLDAEARIIVVNQETYNLKYTYEVSGFENNIGAKKSITYLYYHRKLEIRNNDFFIFTYWKSAYTFIKVLEWQIKTYQLNNRKALYLIQDYEPGFEPWSTSSALAETTYSNNSNLIEAVFNSRELKKYFDNRNYQFSKELFFIPTINSTLKKTLINAPTRTKRDKIILIYGRPSEPRNAFELIRYSLKLWSEDYSKAKDWAIISLGEGFDDIRLKNNTIRSYGKVTLEQYSSLMLKAFVGISLMISPHPSYPPLEMSSFGVKTITNKFENKDLTYFNNNIISLPICNPEEIEKHLIEACNQYYVSNVGVIDQNEEYLQGRSYEETIIELKNDIIQMTQTK